MTSLLHGHWSLLLPVILTATCSPTAVAAETSPAPTAAAEAGAPGTATRFNVPAPTMGGTQFWTDELVFHAWRIQRHVFTGHCRLLDEHDVRRAWGTFEQCQESLQTLRRELRLPPLRPRAVLVLHGLGRSRDSMERLCQYVRANTDLTVLNVGYASTRTSLDAHAEALAKVVTNLEGVQEVSFVAHSMGNIVIRRFLTKSGDSVDRAPCIHRFVMLAPPNIGAQLARQLRDNQLFELLLGSSGIELAQTVEQFERTLTIPSCEFGILAGGRGDDIGRNPLLDGDDDFVVSVAETRLAGARDFMVVPALHTVIMDHPAVQEYTVRFLQQGFFQSAERRCPIPSPP